MERFIYVWLSAYIYISYYTIQTETSCLNPDVPENGNYTSEHSKLEPGDEITYSCKKGFALSGKEKRQCQTSRQWSYHTPFCDPATQLKNPMVGNRSHDSNFLAGSALIDGDTETCVELVLLKNDHIKVPLVQKIIIRTVKIYFKKGPINIQIFTGSKEKMILSSSHTSFLGSDQWIAFTCESKAFSDLIIIASNDNKRFTMCEIEVYGKTGEGCDHSPSRKIEHGRLEVSRSKAVLICDDGFKIRQGNSRLVCEGNNTWVGGVLICDEVLCGLILSQEEHGVRWIFPNMSKKFSFGTTSHLKCNPGFEKVGTPDVVYCQKDGTWTKTNATCIDRINAKSKVKTMVIFIVAVVVVIIIIALLATIICFIRKQKNKEVVVVYQSKSEESVISPLEAQYEPPPYEHLNPPELPTTPRPLPPLAKLSTMSRGGDIQPTAWKATFVKNNLNRPEEAGDTMKSSTLYDSSR